MVRPFYQSRLFWFGIPGLAFLLWCWWDSTKTCSEMAWVRTHSWVALYQFDGRVCLVITEDASEVAPVFSGPAVQFRRGSPLSSWPGSFIGNLFGTGEVDQRQLRARRYFAPGMHHLRWSCPYSPHPGYGSATWLPYREWGLSLWWVVGSYVALLTLSLAGWQSRKRRLLKLQTERL